MSGGHFNYVRSEIRANLETIYLDEDVRKRFPMISDVLEAIGSWVYDLEHEIDYDLSGDAILKVTDRAFDHGRIVALLEIAMKAAPDDLFPRGKWATIQAIQDRAERRP